ncbi:MAG: hypothetical protein JWR70_2531 [Modestobacter sp.]|nr:hypothetical protein [Modestobacter sp.]
MPVITLMTLPISADELPSWVSVVLVLATMRTASSATPAACRAEREMSRMDAVISSAPVASWATFPETAVAVPDTVCACSRPLRDASTTPTVARVRSPTSVVIAPALPTTPATISRIHPMPWDRAALS